MHNYTEIKTERLFLRTLTEDDAAIVRDVEKNFANEFETDNDALNWIRWANNRNDTCHNFYVWLTQTNELIGRVYFHSKAELDGKVEIAYGIKEEYRGKNYATEAAKAVVQFAFEQVGQDVLVAIVKPENIASRRVIEKLGFTNRDVCTVLDENGEECEFDYFQLLRNDWRLLTK